LGVFCKNLFTASYGFLSSRHSLQVGSSSILPLVLPPGVLASSS